MPGAREATPPPTRARERRMHWAIGRVAFALPGWAEIWTELDEERRARRGWTDRQEGCRSAGSRVGAKPSWRCLQDDGLHNSDAAFNQEPPSRIWSDGIYCVSRNHGGQAKERPSRRLAVDLLSRRRAMFSDLERQERPWADLRWPRVYFRRLIGGGGVTAYLQNGVRTPRRGVIWM